MDDMLLRDALCRILQNQVALADMMARAQQTTREHMQDCANRVGFVSELTIKALGGSGSSLLPGGGFVPTPSEKQP
jgi:hypothetical protein